MFFYRLGHIPLLGLSEFETQVGTNQILSYDQFFLKSEGMQNVNDFGSLVYRAKIIQKIEKEDLENYLAIWIKNYLQEIGLKKVGLNFHKKYQKNLIKNAKEAGAKKINLTFKNELNFGDFKQSKNWLQLIYFQNEIFLVHINNFANQEFWSKLDLKLPHNDLKRGIINLKLAKSLFNLAKNPEKWWDPFVGQGRVLVANLNKTQDFFGSDIDENILPETTKNIEFAKEYFKWNQKFLETENKNCENINLFTHDAKNPLNQAIGVKNVVSEGYLGNTLHSHPNDNRAQNEINSVENIWIEFLQNIEKTEIEKIVACLPFYPKIKKMDNAFFEKLVKNILKSSNSSFKIEPFFEQEIFINYNRKTSFTGHLIFRLGRKK